MNTRKTTIAAIAAALVATPMICSAADSAVALNSCVKAFMADLSSRSPATLKLRESRYLDNSAEDFGLATPERTDALTLTARDAHDNHAVGRAICTVNSRGEVMQLHATPLVAGD
jgi:hypothetical protein